MSSEKCGRGTYRVSVTRVVGKLVHCTGILCLQAESLAALSPGQGGLATPPWVVHVKSLSLKG